MNLTLHSGRIQRAKVNSNGQTFWLTIMAGPIGHDVTIYGNPQGGLDGETLAHICDLINENLEKNSFTHWWNNLDTTLDWAGLPGVPMAEARLHFELGRSVQEAFDKIRAGNERVAL